MARRKTQTDEAVLAAALRAIKRVGPIRMTLADVAAESGLAPATLVQRFGSKAGLLAAAFQLGNDQLRDAIQALPERPPDEAAVVAFFAGMARGFDRTTMADNVLMLSEDFRDPVLSAIGAERSALLRGAAERLIPDFVADRPAAARMIEAHWHGAVIQAALSGEADIPGAVAAAMEGLLAMLRAASVGPKVARRS